MPLTRRVTRASTFFYVLAVAAGCATGGPARPSPFPGSVTGREGATALVVPPGVVEGALALRGTPYRLGGENPATGLDCSGLVRRVFLDAGLVVPRTVAQQYDAGVRVNVSQIRPGDLIFFDTLSPGPSHVGIAIDRATFVHAPGTGGVVRIDQLNAPYWKSRLRGVRRLGVIPPPATPQGLLPPVTNFVPARVGPE